MSRHENGTTLRVLDTGLRDSDAVLKLQRIEDDRQQEFLEFSELLCGIRHVNVATPYTYGVVRAGDREVFGYTTREFIAGQPLVALATPLDTESVGRVATQVSMALSALHRRGICHQDLKPENVVARRTANEAVDERTQCLLIDLSFRPPAGQQSLNEVTLQYVAPELLAGEQASPRSDLYSLGVLLYRLLTGELPFAGDSVGEVIQAQRSRAFLPIDSYRDDVPGEVLRSVERLLEPYPENRPSSAEQVIAGLSGSFVHAQQVPVLFDGFVGRDTELNECLDKLGRGSRAEGMTAIEISGARQSGVTTLLREIQDRLETEGVLVLTARPRVRSGRSLQEQLLDPVHTLLRRVAATESQLSQRAPANSPTDLLDDFLVISHGRRVVVFVDDWHDSLPDELRFLHRLILQDSTTRLDRNRDGGRCQLVLGRGVRLDGVCSIQRQVAAEVEGHVALAPWTRVDLQRLLQLSSSSDFLPAAIQDQVVSAADGRPGAIVALVGRLATSTERSAETVSRLQESSPTLRISTELQGDQKSLAHPQCHALAALSAWGEWMPTAEWRQVRETLGTSLMPEPTEWLEFDGQNRVRICRDRVAPRTIAMLGEEVREAVASAVLDAVRQRCRSGAHDVLLAALRFLTRARVIPPRQRWIVRRAVLVLFRRAQHAEIANLVSELARCGDGTLAAELELAGRAALVEAGLLANGEGEPTSLGGWHGIYGAWTHARGLWKSRRRSEALSELRAVIALLGPGSLCQDAILEDYGVLAAETGKLDEAREAQRKLIQRLIAYKRTGTSDRRVVLRQRARVFRVRHRVHLRRGYSLRAVRCARRECVIHTALGDLVGTAASLNNAGVALLAASAPTEAAKCFESCGKLRERLDDERGLVAVLNNLAVAHSRNGDAANAASVLNRARVVASRNGLARHALLSTLNLGVAYVRVGQWRDARRVFGRLIAKSADADDWDVHSRSILNYALLALDSWHVSACARLLDRVRTIRVERTELAPLPIADIEAEFAIRLECRESLRELAKRKCVVAAAAADVLDSKKGVRWHRRDRAVRLRMLSLAALHGQRRIRGHTTKRLLRFARVEVSSRMALELIAAHLKGGPGVAGPASLDLGWKALSDPSLRSGHEDLQVLIRARMGVRLKASGREQEAWRVIEEGLRIFRRLERKLAPVEKASAVLSRAYTELCQAVGVNRGAERSNRTMTTRLEAEAFRKLASGATDRALRSQRELVTEIAEVVSGRRRDGDVTRLLDIAVRATGAHRAILVRGDERERRIVATGHAEGDHAAVANSDLSWAVVSKVLESGRAEIYDDALAAEQLASHRSIATLNLRSLACLPVRGPSGVLGVLYLDHHGMAGLFRDDDLALLTLIANLIASTMDTVVVSAQASENELKLAEAHRQLVRAERNRLAGQLAAGMAHDLRNVMTAIIARCQLAQQRPEGEKQSLISIEQAAHSAVGLIGRLQDCSREHVLQREETVVLGVLAREAIELLSARIANEVHVECKSEGKVAVSAVPGEIRELFVNLILNALDAIQRQGNVTLSITRDGDSAVIEVSDDGPGMPESVRERVFEPFFTTKGNNGTGLGLAVVKSVVVRHAGTIEVISEVGEGTKFIIRLPVASRPEPDVKGST